MMAKPTTKFIFIFFLFKICDAQPTGNFIYIPGAIIDSREKAGAVIDNSNTMWIAFTAFMRNTGELYVSKNGLASYKDSLWTFYNTQNSPLPTNYLTCIHNQNNTLWIGSVNGLIKKDGASWTIFNKQNSNLLNDTVTDLVVKSGTVYLATPSGISAYNGTSWTNYTQQNSALPNTKINSLDIDKQNNIWLATNHGIYKFKNGSVLQHFNQNNNQTFLPDTFLTIACNNDKILAGSNSYEDSISLVYPGLYILNNSMFENINYYKSCDADLTYPIKYTAFYKQAQMPYLHRKSTQKYDSGINLIDIEFNGIWKSYALPKNHYLPSFLCTNAQNKMYILTTTNAVIVFDIIKDAVKVNELFPVFEPMEELDINNAKIPINLKGDFLNDYRNFASINKFSCKKIAYGAGVWFGGLFNNNVHLAAATYRLGGLDYGIGPLNTQLIEDTLVQQKFSRHWKINRNAIEDFKLNFSKPGYVFPEPILTWPAHGDTLKGYAKYLAPFIDVDNDGIYSPQKGDYPDIKGDQSIYWIFNDNIKSHNESGAEKLGIEIHGLAYGYACDKISDNDLNKALNNTTFYSFKIINRSNNSYTNFKSSFFLDPEIGNYWDDEVGSNPKEGYAFATNLTDHDYTWNGFGDNLPGLSILICDGFKDSLNNNLGADGFMSIDNDFSVQGNPGHPWHYYNYMNSRFKNGKKVSYGGYGYGGSDTFETNYMFPGTNDMLNRPNWSMRSFAIQPNDRRMLINSKPVNLKPNDEQTITYALVYTPTTTNNYSAILNEINTDVLKVKDWFNYNNFPSCSNVPLGLLGTKFNKESIMLFPNPVADILEVKSTININNSAYRIIGIDGKEVGKGAIKNNKLNTNFLSNGIYILIVEANNGALISKFIKQ